MFVLSLRAFREISTKKIISKFYDFAYVLINTQKSICVKESIFYLIFGIFLFQYQTWFFYKYMD